MKPFKCKCGNVLFFDNSVCLQCGSAVGYDPDKREMAVIDPKGKLALCANGVTHGACNWLVKTALPLRKAPPPPGVLCKSCQLTRTIPDFSDPNNVVLWARTEAAKRRLLVTFDLLGINLPPKAADPARGIAFDLISHKTSPQLMMGHLNGVITVHVDEADDTAREIARSSLNEPVRTMLGHFRHESGHYAWERWQNPLPPEDLQRLAFREVFGDERVDYNAAVANHYQVGPPPDWQSNFISAYASTHPWEDFAETWSFYLQMVDGLETVDAMGLQQGRKALYVKPFPAEAGTLPEMLPQKRRNDRAFLDWLHRWIGFSTVLNELSKSLGHAPLDPFVLSIPVAKKLRLIHWLVEEFRNAR